MPHKLNRSNQDQLGPYGRFSTHVNWLFPIRLEVDGRDLSHQLSNPQNVYPDVFKAIAEQCVCSHQRIGVG